MDMMAALRTLGVREGLLSDTQRDHLDKQGYIVLPDILSPEQVSQFAHRLDELEQLEGVHAGIETHQEVEAVRLSDLVNKDPLFTLVFTHPVVLAAVSHVMKGEFRLSSINSRTPRPGFGSQHMHRDFDGSFEPGEYHACNTVWVLDAFTLANGPTRIVPGSHCWSSAPSDVMKDLAAPHPDEVLVQAQSGSVVVMNAHAWHSGTRNRSGQVRRAFHTFFCRREEPQETDQRKYIRPETYARLSDAARFILDV